MCTLWLSKISPPPPHKRKTLRSGNLAGQSNETFGKMAVTQSMDSRAVYAEGPSK
jgi:hypothetical protein